MAYIVTGFGQKLADPATIQAFETSVVNANALLLEGAIGSDRVTIANHESRIAFIESKSTGSNTTIQNSTPLGSSASVGTTAALVANGLILPSKPYNQLVRIQGQADVTGGTSSFTDVGIWRSGTQVGKLGRVSGIGSAYCYYEEVVPATNTPTYVLQAQANSGTSNITNDGRLTALSVTAVPVQ